MTWVFYAIHPSFAMSTWASVAERRGKVEMRTCTFAAKGDRLLTGMVFDYPEVDKRAVDLDRPAYQALMDIIAGIEIRIWRPDAAVGCDGTFRELFIHQGLSIVAVRWWEDDLGQWAALARVQEWFAERGVA